jgi:peroxin-1
VGYSNVQAAQNAIVELQYIELVSSVPGSKDNSVASQRSVYVGWTGMSSKRKVSSAIGRGSSRDSTGRDVEANVVEIDSTFARTIGLTQGQRVGVLLHLDPPLAHTVNIEPLTPGDWEIIELHANFLEINLLSQIRALPNPSFTATPSTQAQQVYPLTLHLSPTSAANIIVSSLVPPLPSSSPFAKIAPDAEVIVAPNMRPRLSHADRTKSRSIISTSKRSAGSKSGVGSTRQRSHRKEVPNPVFLRGVDRQFCGEWFPDGSARPPEGGLKIWIDEEILASKPLRCTEWVSVSVVQPAGLEPSLDPQQQQRLRDIEASDAGKPALKVVAKVLAWDDAPDSQHAVLSSPLCSTLGVEKLTGGVLRIEAAPPPMPRSTIKAFKVFPFTTGSRDSAGLRFGGETKTTREATAEKIKTLYGGKDHEYAGLMDGPLTNGLALPKPKKGTTLDGWEGGLLRFETAHHSNDKPEKNALRWILGSDLRLTIEVQQETPNTFQAIKASAAIAERLPPAVPSLIGIDNLINQLFSHLSRCSSVLLTGGLGSGKTSLARLLGCRLRSASLYHTTFFSCRRLGTEETRVSTIKERLNKLFMGALWGARLGGRSVVILDDLDRLCPVETESQNTDNGRSRQVSEIICSTVHQYCGGDSKVVLLATAQSKESLNSVVVGGHVVREIVSLKAPNKDGRRQVLQALLGQTSSNKPIMNGHSPQDDQHEAAWMDGSLPSSPTIHPTVSEQFAVDRTLDVLDLAGQTDGYMPGDLLLLVSRARNEALISTIEAGSHSAEDTSIRIGKEHFECALDGFSPASLRNVTLQSSKTTFDSIGGLHETRKILLETLQYPTTYAPIFAQCPLRLRSGLLLYGYPGCGKTLLASAVAGECGLNFISVKGPEILNKYIGASEKSVRDLFERAESARPCVLFFDEFDSIAPKRGHDSTGVTDRVVNQLLTQMDGAEGLSGVYVLAATSRPDLIDPALLRPGRLDKSLICDLPSLRDRLDILQTLSKKLKVSPDVLSTSDRRETLLDIAYRTEGYSGADLQAVIYNAHLEAIHDVLGDHGSSNGTVGMKSKDRKGNSRPATENDIIQFRYGAELDTSLLNSSKHLLDRVTILAKLDAVKQVKRKERHARHGHPDQLTKSDVNGATNGKGAEPQEVVIQWKHIEASLAVTRSSISADERRRLERIYREFVVGRNGEMPSGQGPEGVGGRSSLM